jgi:hypothetical protein
VREVTRRPGAALIFLNPLGRRSAKMALHRKESRVNPYILLVCAALAGTGLAVQAMPPAQPSSVTGEVLEVRDVPSYTYMRLKTKEGEVWAAVSTAPVRKGARVTLDNPMVMENFESKALGKKFDRIVFASLADPGAKSGRTAPAPHGTPPAPAAPVGKIPKATGPGAKTVAEVVAGRASLENKPVTIRGQVVKFNAGILGKNWVHLQDGSGSAAGGTHDILLTTTDTTAVGDVVNATGTVRTNVDLGSGYTYAVLVEEARIRK